MTRMRMNSMGYLTRVPTAIPALDRIRLEHWVTVGPGIPACGAPPDEAAGPRGPAPGCQGPTPGPSPGPQLSPPGGLAGVGVKVGCGLGGSAGTDPAGLAGSGGG